MTPITGGKMIPANSGIEERDKIRTWLQIGIFLMISMFFADWLIRRVANAPVAK